MEGDSLLQCFNRGCGQKFNPNDNKEDSCRHHPGQPFFHDAYKGWSCCNKKCTDFTEFLNIKGCTTSPHSNVKPPEPEKPAAKVDDVKVVEVKPLVSSALVRPPYDTPMTTMVPEIAPSLKQQAELLIITNKDDSNSDEIALGTACKNGGCNVSYQGPITNEGTCIYHPGVPVFHEGMKYWSCCQRKTTDFTAFLNQAGCERGKHLWKKEDSGENKVNCRWDYHQTGSYVVVSIYAKQYCIKSSLVKLNPIRLFANLVFPQQSNASFQLDLELKGIIEVKGSQVSMFGTKVEIKLKKAEPGSWSRLDIPRKNDVKTVENMKTSDANELASNVEGVDLSDL